MRISFFGAAREVTGSNVLLECAGKRILLECGFFQGVKQAEERNYAPFAFDPKTIDFLVICHAHLDHVGRIPKLVREGFDGKIFSTAPTKEIARLVLEDSLKLMIDESKRDKHAPLYSQEDILRSLQLFEAVGYDHELEIADGIKLLFKNAGHILGSASVLITADGKSLFYSSDIGNAPSVLLSAPQTAKSADYVIMESTYGARVHEDVSKRGEKLNSVINGSIATNGVVLIPTFAIERTQELLLDIGHFCQTNNCLIPTFFLDSPLAEKVTQVFEKYPEFLSKKIATGGPGGFGHGNVRMTTTVEQSKEIRLAPNPKIIMAGAGMMNGGRILYHLQDYIEDEKTTLLIVGYQAKGTLGRRILEGEHEIKIYGKKYTVRANIKAIGSYSAHADAPQLLSWLSSIGGVKKVFLVHGESEQAVVFAKKIDAELKIPVEMPQQGESFDL